MMYQRESRVMQAPEALPKPARMESKQSFLKGSIRPPFGGPCTLECLQAFKLGKDGSSSHVIYSYCAAHDYVGEANSTLGEIFMEAHKNGTLYPRDSKLCYDGEFHTEKLYRIHELIPCEACSLRFLSENDLGDHQKAEHLDLTQ